MKPTAADKTLLDLEKPPQTSEFGLSSLKIPSAARLPESSASSDFAELTESLLSGSGDSKTFDELNAKLKGFVIVSPIPGLCIKMKKKDGKKMFVNLCTSEKVPQLDKEFTEEELADALRTDKVSFRIPMSIGEPHTELDHSGESCEVYDVVVNPSLFSKIESSDLFYNFVLSLALEGLEAKYQLTIDRTSTVRLNKKVFGKLLEQRIRTKPKMITEVESEENAGSLSNLHKTPEFELWLDPNYVNPRLLSAEIKLPDANRLEQLDLFVADDRLVLSSSLIKPKNYRLDIMLPVSVESSKADPVFNRTTKILTVKVPVKQQAADQ